MSDDNLCGDIRALVTVLREIRDEQKRVADALERVALLADREGTARIIMRLGDK